MPFEGLNRQQEQLSNLIRLYRQDIEQFEHINYNETQVRVDFVNPFFQILGWDVLNENGLPQHLREVTHEATVIVEEDGTSRSKKPDYSFKIGTETLFFVETKKPSVDISVDRAPSFQLRRYGWSGNLKISVLTNFKDLYIYDCSVRPVEGDDTGVALIAHYNYSEYENKFEEIYGLLSKQAVLSGEFERHFGNIQGAFRREPFNEYFLEQIRTWRNNLGQDVLNNNADIDNETLNLFVQRILNRTIFLRICEDRNFENYESLKRVTTYEELKQLFVSADQRYDSGLFEMLDEDNLSVSDDIIINIFQSLYYPNNSYEFSVIDPYIIGQIYELFLDESLEIKEDGTICVVLKPEMVDSQGAVNTPKNITDIIVEKTLEPLFTSKTLQEVREYGIADICCGSGNFLLSAYEYIVNFYIEHLTQNDFDEAIRRGDIYQIPGSTTLFLSYDLKRTILKNMIYGVDIDPLAVEVTKFSLLLKVLENTSAEEIDSYSNRTHNKVLPNLDENIKIGNSLVDQNYARYDRTIYSNPELMNKIKIFDWTREFGGRKFDAIVGNPPYIRVQKMVHYSPEEYSFYKNDKSNYMTSKAETLDKYYLFIEKSISLLNENGMLGYIIPHKFMNIKSGAELRELMASNSVVREIYHFGTHQIFKNRSTYTCVLILSKKMNESFEIGFVQDLNRFLFEHNTECKNYPSQYLTRQPWTFLPQDIENRLEQLSDKCVPLSDLADVFVGVQTSADDIYIIHSEREDDLYVYGHERSGTEIQIEKGILRKSVYDAKLTSYEKVVANSFIIFPYKEVNGKPKLYTEEEMEQKFPCALDYLQKHRETLDKRKMDRRNESDWYAFGRSQSLRRFMSGEHLIWPVLSLSSNYVYDNEMIVFTGGGNGPFYGLEMKASTNVSIFYIQAVLNHWLMELLVKNKASTFRGDYYSHGKQFISSLPIYNINLDVSEEREVYQQIINSVQTLMQLKEQLKTAPNRARRVVLERLISTANNELNALIDALYQVEAQENEDLE